MAPQICASKGALIGCGRWQCLVSGDISSQVRTIVVIVLRSQLAAFDEGMCPRTNCTSFRLHVLLQ